MKIWIIYSLIVTVFAVAAGSFAIGVAVSGGFGDDSEVVQTTAAPTESRQPQPTEYRPRLTATEAASKSKNHLFTALNSSTTSADAVRFVLGFSCETRDFNENDLAWIVVCSNPDSEFEFTYAVNDQTGKVEQR